VSEAELEQDDGNVDLDSVEEADELSVLLRFQLMSPL